MDFVYTLVVALHLLGMAALVGGYFTVAAAARGRVPVPGPVMLWGARLQLLTGLVVVGLGEAVLDNEYDSAKLAVKLLVAVVVAALVEIASARARKDRAVASGLVHAAGGLAVLNVLVAVLWG
jgi:hypothetical protein